ncbi:hypothetical protein KEJ26_01360 [Candidatus Bathyarchaeota archaeon]|nr:hypothetical protein [Candidatus Bathyarchaeota archaeon]
MNSTLRVVLRRLFYAVDAYGVFLALFISFVAVKTVEPDRIGLHSFVAVMSAFLAVRCVYNLYFNWRMRKRT